MAEISRRAGMSQGSFYQYFRNKEQAFLELNDEILAGFGEKAARLDLTVPRPEDRLAGIIELLLAHCRDNYYFHRILGEFELIDPVTIGYYDSVARFLRGFFRREIAAGCTRPIDPNVVAYGLIGIASFHAMDWGPEGEHFPIDDLVAWTTRFLHTGIGGPTEWQKPRDITVALPPPGLPEPAEGPIDATQGQATARALLQAAEKVFGEYGFNRAGVADITRHAGVAQGTFYVHFKSKQDLMEQFVRYLSRQVRWELKKATAGLTDRREVERVGMIAFFRFLTPHRQIYRVVAESETMGREMAMWYYKKLAAGYEPGLAEGAERGDIRSDMPSVFLTRCIMGLIHMIGLKWLVWNSSPQAELPRQVLEDIILLVLEGLAPD